MNRQGNTCTEKSSTPSEIYGYSFGEKIVVHETNASGLSTIDVHLGTRRNNKPNLGEHSRHVWTATPIPTRVKLQK